MKSFLILIVGLFLFKNGGLAQCSNGQSPSSSFPLCASNTFSQSIVPTCPGTPIPVPACSGAAVTFDDRNPYYYKFTAFQAQPFVFTITPLTNSDDYDWQLFDVTGKNPSDIYTDASMFVCCNWSGNTGKTGTSINATTANSCEGNAPNITKAPTLIKDHDYILLISHFTANGQSGYNLSISNAAGLVDTTAPTVKNITAKCVANQILVKLNKKMKCNSITASGSEFNITNNPIIASVEGFECANGFDTDSIIISLASPLPNGNYSVKIKNGTDGNTVLDNCDNGIPVNQSFDFAVVGASQPTLIDSIKTINCEPTSIKVVFKAPIKCNAVDISDFEISGASAVNIVAATVNCGSNGLGNTVTLLFSNPITATGLYKLNIRLGNDGNTILNQCDVATPEGTFIDFNVFAKPSADFTTQIINETCKADTLIYSHNINNSVNKWFWTFDGLPANSTLQSQQVIYNSFNNRVVTLAVYNAACTATITKNIAIADHLLIPKINASRDTTCPNNPETFIDSSKGNIISLFWDFANGQTSTSATPPTQIYPVLPINKLYPTKLVVTTAFGCIDSVTKNIFVRGTIPTEFDSIIPPTCAAREVKIYFNQAMICSSVSTDGSEFSISGTSSTNIIGASINCIDGVGTVVTLQLSNALVTGSYQISLNIGSDGNTIINDCGIATLPKTLSFNALGHVDPTFTYNTPKWGCLADTITFNHTINNLANSWQWNFIDGSPNIANSVLQSPTVIYSGLTNHQVQLVASNGICYDTALQTVTIIDHSINANFGFPDTTCGNGNTIFTDSSTQQITNWSWSFGNNMTSNLQQPLPINYPLSYNYARYPVNLIVKNIVGCIDTAATKFITVKPAAPAIIEKMGAISCSPDSIIIHFNSAMLCSSVAANGSDFYVSGVSTPTVASASCVNGSNRDILVKLVSPIALGGMYQLNLKKGIDGNTILNDCYIESPASSINFLAYPKVDASFTVVKAINCFQDTLYLNHIVANDETKWNWIVNGSFAGNISSIALPYNATQTFRVSLTSSNLLCQDVYEKNIDVVVDKVKAKFAISNDIICPSETVEFQNLSSGNIKTFSWLWNDKQFYNAVNPPAQNYTPSVFQQPYQGTRYNVDTIALIVGNDVPCYDTAYTTIKIAETCIIKVPSAFTPNNDGLNDYLFPLNAYKANGLIFKVYNRLGNVIFQSNNYSNKWDGNYNGDKQPAGTYIWTLDYTDTITGKKISSKGTTVLIR